MTFHPSHSVFQGQNARELYGKQLSAITSDGYETETRGRKTIELLNVLTVIDKPQQMCVLIPERRWNPWIALSESLWVLAGLNTVKELLPYNKYIKDYSDDGETLYGAYGYRIRDQLPDLIERLRKDPNDRRAVLQIWDVNDLIARTFDPPCNDMVMFKLREGKLHMTVLNRSNDIHWGLYAVNIPEFAMLQLCIASILGVQAGTQTHLSNSLHYYTDEPRAKAITRRMLAAPQGFEAYPKTHEIFSPGYRLEQWQYWALQTLNNQTPKLATAFGIFAAQFLRFYRESRKVEELDKLPFTDYYPDWVEAGRMFLEKSKHE